MATASVTYTFAPNTLIESSKANTNFADLVTFLNSSTMHRDASSAFTAVPSGPATDASSDNQFVRKRMADIRQALTVQTVSGIAWGSGTVMTTINNWASAVNQPSASFTLSTSTITVLRAGWHKVGCLLTHTGIPGSGTQHIRIALNGASTLVEHALINVVTPQTSSLHVEIPYLCSAGDQFTVQTAQNSGGTSSLFGRFWIQGLAWT